MSEKKGFDFSAGVAASHLAEGAAVAGHVGKKEIVVVRRGEEFFAIGAQSGRGHRIIAGARLPRRQVVLRVAVHFSRQFASRTGTSLCSIDPEEALCPRQFYEGRRWPY